MCLRTDNEAIQAAAAKLVLAAERLLQSLQDPESDNAAEINDLHSAISLVCAAPADKLEHFKRIEAGPDRQASKTKRKKRALTSVELFEEARKLAKRAGISVRARWMASTFEAFRNGNLLVSRSDPGEFLAAVRKLVRVKGA